MLRFAEKRRVMKYKQEDITRIFGEPEATCALNNKLTADKDVKNFSRRSAKGGISSLNRALKTMTRNEILEHQKQWWHQEYSNDAMDCRLTSVLSQKRDNTDWLTAEEADEEVGRNLPWLKLSGTRMQ